MKKYIYICFAWVMMSCNDFVDVIPKGNTIPETVDDLAKMMNNSSFGSTRRESSEVSCSLSDNITLYSDDYTVTDNPESWAYSSVNNPIIRNICAWADYVYDEAEEDYDWNKLYKSNYIVNYIINNIDHVKDGISYRREEVKGEALVHRAMNYFLLVNLYGKQYNEQTASEDLGVPLMLEADINKQVPRATVAKVYEQIFTDLNEALSLLKTDMPKFNHIPGRAAAYALRARVYLWQQNYDKAYEDAVEALKIRNQLIDYNTLVLLSPEDGPFYGIDNYEINPCLNTEELYSRFYMDNGISMLTYSPTMLSIIDQENDLRYKMFVGTLDGMYFNTITGRIIHSGITTAEVWLTKAEAALRKSQPDVQEAINALDEVRIHRYQSATYQPTKITDKKLLLTEILKERRREIVYTEMSFLDHKRQNADPATARPMSRPAFGTTYTLPADDPHWQLPIPLNVMAMNKLLIQNER